MATDTNLLAIAFLALALVAATIAAADLLSRPRR